MRAGVLAACLGVAAASGLAGQTISSAANQTFYVGGPSTAASAITITDPNGKIKPGNGIWIYFPATLAMDWDNTMTTLTITGSAASRVSTTPTYSANGDTVKLTVLSGFIAGDQITVSGLAFKNFTATGTDTLRLTAGTVTGAKDNKSKTIANAVETISSAANQTFVVGDPSTAASTVTITEGATPAITATNDIRVRIPTGFNMTWNTAITTATIGGGAASKVSTTVSYENSGQVLVLNVTTNFAALDQITVSGLAFNNFTAASAANNLQLVVSGSAGGATAATDDKTKTIVAKVYGVSVSPHATTASQLPSNGTNYTVGFSVTNTGNGYTSYDLLTSKRPGGVITTVSITGAGITQGANPDSARLTNLLAPGSATATVTYSVGNVAAGSIDTLVFKARAVGNATTIDSGKMALTVVRPSMTIAKTVNPTGTQPPGTDLTYTMTITNGGTSSAASVVVVDTLSSTVQFKVGSVASTLPAGVSVVVAYSSDGGATWTYVPASGGCSAPASYDRCVNRIRWSLQNPLSSTAPNNTGTLQFVAQIR